MLSTRRHLLRSIGFGSFALTAGAGTASAHDPPSVRFEDQTAHGKTVAVASAHLPDGGFIVIHDLDAGGAVVGHTAPLQPGQHENVRVTVDSRKHENLLAMLHRNTGKRTYEFPNADPPYFDGGTPVVDAAVVTFPTPMGSGQSAEP